MPERTSPGDVRMEKIGFLGNFTMENWKNWENVRLFCRILTKNLRKNGELQDFTMENEGIEVFHHGNKRFHLKFKHTRP
jgi:hypothetical protein